MRLRRRHRQLSAHGGVAYAADGDAVGVADSTTTVNASTGSIDQSDLTLQTDENSATSFTLTGDINVDTIAFEDSDVGTLAAHAAGIRVIQIPDVKAPSEECASLGHLIFDSLDKVRNEFGWR